MKIIKHAIIIIGIPVIIPVCLLLMWVQIGSQLAELIAEEIAKSERNK